MISLADVYLKDFGYFKGKSMKISQLVSEKHIRNDTEYLYAEGYEEAAVADEPPIEFIEKNINIPHESELLIYNVTFPSNTIYCTEKGDAEANLFYSGEKLITDKKRTDMRYIGISQQGCTGLMSAVDIGSARILMKRNRNVICISNDILPKGIYRDMKKQKMLLSDTVSYVELSAEPAPYRLLKAADKSVAAADFFGIAAATEALIAELCDGFTVPNKLENIIFPNHWLKVWRSFLLRSKYKSRFTDSSIKTLAHGLSADGICNLLLAEERGCITSGEKQAVISYGYGGHLRGLLIEKQ